MHFIALPLALKKYFYPHARAHFPFFAEIFMLGKLIKFYAFFIYGTQSQFLVI